MEKIVAVVSLMVASVVVVLASSHPAQAGDEKKPEALVSPPLSINPTEGQPICLVSNVGVSTSVSVTVDIIDATGATVVSNQIELSPGGIDAKRLTSWEISTVLLPNHTGERSARRAASR